MADAPADEPKKASGLAALLILIFIVILLAYVLYSMAVSSIKSTLAAFGMNFTVKNDAVSVTL